MPGARERVELADEIRATPTQLAGEMFSCIPATLRRAYEHQSEDAA